MYMAAITFHVITLEPFTFSCPEEWDRWIRRFERFRVASGQTLRGDDVQVNTLIYTMLDQADNILHSLTLSEEDRKNYSVVKDKFNSYFIRRRNVIYKRTRFNCRKQEEGKIAEAFITVVRLRYCAGHDLYVIRLIIDLYVWLQ